VIQLAFDVLIFDVSFSGQQIIGIAIVLLANTVKWVHEIRKAFFEPKPAIDTSPLEMNRVRV